MVQPNAELQDWERTLEGFHYPLSLVEIRKRAREVGGVDSEVHDFIGRLTRAVYETREQLVEEIRALYVAGGVPADKLPL